VVSSHAEVARASKWNTKLLINHMNMTRSCAFATDAGSKMVVHAMVERAARTSDDDDEIFRCTAVKSLMTELRHSWRDGSRTICVCVTPVVMCAW
jgi:hypothetical protein